MNTDNEEFIDLSSDSEPEANAPGEKLHPPIQIPPLNESIGETIVAPEKSTRRKSNELKKLGKGLQKFNPEKSNREKRKLQKRLFQANEKKTGHDSSGFIYGSELNLCDCLCESCIGCFFPCPDCGSRRCGIECRIDRKWLVESIENEADHFIIRNKFYPQ